MQQMTHRQQEILQFVCHSITESGYPPTIREIGDEFGIRSTNGVNDHLKALAKKGYLNRGDKKSRALTPTEKGLTALGVTAASTSIGRAVLPPPNLVEVPLLGRVAAGEPILAQEDAEDTVLIDSFFLGGTSLKVFALKVVGESMINDGIYDGDYIFVKKQITAESGDIVVAMIDDEATVKRYYPEGDRIRFQPSNDNMKPIYVHRNDFHETQILGVLCGVYRRYN